ncbi:hypothetical protein HMPREF0542_12113 [Ligilactobacillus ruminis ATCC 25644]|uniref:Uncharacterized protein n=1 Tax=Ligilactobacillus ruminis ATCC 25644 TaxID=525362 RepID=E7FT85_9LACO|nr:hypothetical protein HMPREF0542_12113 [Ligilactobacillus ruminis ATCC 25644]EGX98694.1 hypothetical protein ANHS_752 [Ligilactobacillus ruminis ATCC 25644]MBD8999960.1 PTS fructose transporter subunit IIA [Ligilactobacillus ruminis]MBS7036968.1 PTS fructose transporter subunit IIA [Ligilactobacillus ruminis]
MTTGSIRASILKIILIAMDILICMMFYLAVEKKFLNDEIKEV